MSVSRFALVAALLLLSIPAALAQGPSTTPASGAGDAHRGGPPQGAASHASVHPIWILIATSGFVVFVLFGLFWRRRQEP
jgi:hypothetical protein